MIISFVLGVWKVIWFFVNKVENIEVYVDMEFGVGFVYFGFSGLVVGGLNFFIYFFFEFFLNIWYDLFI